MIGLAERLLPAIGDRWWIRSRAVGSERCGARGQDHHAHDTFWDSASLHTEVVTSPALSQIGRQWPTDERQIGILGTASSDVSRPRVTSGT
ncbi:hypothetical protein [Dietzia sp. ANT_WB102]|uniref:hypothetical protein n=1 Tax=Dietzia sp. ANT_WB102 TaxID=2597345 RepID=UPI0011EBC280|nr:hypothetical protein [Dietzia sp. ANT_WB102]KAA0918224.1 hypothetical protein FQ137_02310 [Dietzia sp. ANT_WB102]